MTLLLGVASVSSVDAQDASLRDEVRSALKKAGEYFHAKVASHGGYVYYYSLDLEQRWGEGKADRETLFVQPPGTPTVGMAFLKAYDATRDPFYLKAAQDAAHALVYGQLQSGGWTQTIHFARAKRMGKYRHGNGGGWNVSSLDDGQTQAALQCLVLTDHALEFRDAKIHEAAEYGLRALLNAQFPNGGFPQVWIKPVEAKPVLRAKFPDYDWRTEGKIRNYYDAYTLNDGLAGTVAETLIVAHRVYQEAKYLHALEKLGDFLILAQMPEPQPAWGQQYNDAMVPIWARKFEPPAITAWESQDVMETLLTIADDTGKKKYLEPLPAALAYLKKSRLPEGNFARFYELKTNRPLYMDSRYQLTYDSSSAPAHYGWKQPSRLDRIQKAYETVRLGKTLHVKKPTVHEKQVRRILDSLDADGRWVLTYSNEKLVGQPKFSPGFRYLSSAEFSRNVESLSAFLQAKK